MNKYRVTIEDRVYEVLVEEETAKEEPGRVEVPPQRIATEKPKGTSVDAPLSGTILSVKVKKGDKVKRGDVLVSLEALKLENDIPSTATGTVLEIVSAGETVETGQSLAIIG